MMSTAEMLFDTYAARRVLFQALGDSGDWKLARELQNLGAEQVDLLVGQRPAEELWAVRNEYQLRPTAMRWICSSIYNLWDMSLLPRYDALVLRGLQHHADPLAALMHMRNVDVPVVAIETTLVHPFQFTDAAGNSFSISDGQQLFAPRLSPLGHTAIQNYFRRQGLDLGPRPQDEPEVDEIGEYRYPGMWSWFLTPGGVRDLLLRAGWEPEAELPVWGPNASFFFCRRTRARRRASVGKAS